MEDAMELGLRLGRTILFVLRRLPRAREVVRKRRINRPSSASRIVPIKIRPECGRARSCIAHDSAGPAQAGLIAFGPRYHADSGYRAWIFCRGWCDHLWRSAWGPDPAKAAKSRPFKNASAPVRTDAAGECSQVLLSASSSPRWGLGTAADSPMLRFGRRADGS